MSVQAMEWAYKQSVPNPGKKFVLVSLANFADGDGHCFPGQKRLAKMTDQSDRTVRRHLKELEAEGFIERSARFRPNGSRTSDSYQILWNRPPPDNLTGGHNDRTPPDNLTGPPGQALSYPEPSFNRHKEPSAIKAKKNKFDAFLVKLPSFLEPTIWAAWVQHRQEIKKPLTPRTVEAQLRDLKIYFADVGRDPNERLQEAISGGWQGFCFAQDKERAKNYALQPPGNLSQANTRILKTAHEMYAALGGDDAE